jgi:hypothetical protein
LRSGLLFFLFFRNRPMSFTPLSVQNTYKPKRSAARLQEKNADRICPRPSFLTSPRFRRASFSFRPSPS